jgi:hypothetical protein
MSPSPQAYSRLPKRYLLPPVLFAIALVVIPLTVDVGRSQNSGTLRGVITDRFDVGISDVLVSLFSPDRVLQVKSNKTGRFEFANTPSGTYELDASHEGFQTQKFDRIRIPEMDAEVMSITLPIANPGSDCGRGPSPTYEKLALGQSALIGVVRDYAGGPLAGFKLRLSKAGATRVLASQSSNEKGEFQFQDIEPGQYVVRASHKGTWVAQSEIFWITRENITRIMLDPVKRGSIIICQ